MKAGRQNWNEYVLSYLLPNQLRTPPKALYGTHSDNQMASYDSF